MTVNGLMAMVIGKSRNNTNVILRKWMHLLVKNYAFLNENYPKLKQEGA